MKKISVFLIIPIIIFSCSKNNYPVLTTTQNDSVRIEYVKEYIERWRIDTVYIEIPAQEKQYEGNKKDSFLETDYAESNARINPDGSLFHDLKNKAGGIPAAVPVKDTELKERNDSIVYRDKRVDVPVKVPLTKWESFWIRSGQIGWVLFLIFIAWFIKRLIKK